MGRLAVFTKLGGARLAISTYAIVRIEELEGRCLLVYNKTGDDYGEVEIQGTLPDNLKHYNKAEDHNPFKEKDDGDWWKEDQDDV